MMNRFLLSRGQQNLCRKKNGKDRLKGSKVFPLDMMQDALELASLGRGFAKGTYPRP